MGLRARIFIGLLPLVAVIGVFMGGYYVAHKALLEQQLTQSTALAISSGTKELNHFLTLQSQEFLHLSALFDSCESTRQIPDQELRASLALGHSNAFSAVVITDEQGYPQFTRLSAIHSNRFVLPRSLGSEPLLSGALLMQLQQRRNEWLQQRADKHPYVAELRQQQRELEARKELNSVRYRDIQSQLTELSEFLQTPPTSVHFGGGDKAIGLGLPFREDTYIYARPIVGCESNPQGYLVAFLDRTQIDGILGHVIDSLASEGIAQAEVLLGDTQNQRWLTPVQLLAPKPNAELLAYSGSEPIRPAGVAGFVASCPVADAGLLNRLVSLGGGLRVDSNIDQHIDADDTSFRLLVFVHERELDGRLMALLKQVGSWALLALIGLLVLIWLLASHISTPLVTLERRVRGLARGDALEVSHEKRDDEIGRLIGSFDRMAQALARKEQLLRQQACTDSLTGCLTRRALAEAATALYQDASEENRPLTLLLMDLDHFKQINDRFGHAVGDQVLIRFCHAVRECLRDSDLFGRFGGEEFVVLLDNHAPEVGYQVADRIRQQVAALSVEAETETEGGDAVSVSVSIGVSGWQPDQNLDQVIQSADKRLYQAKADGRNRVVS